jgi:hypothetical protein
VQLDVAVAAGDGRRRDPAHDIGVGVAQQAGIGRKLRSAGAAEEAVERQAGRLAGDVPQRDVEAGQAEGDGAVAPEEMQLLLQVAADAADVAGIAADGERRDWVRGGPSPGCSWIEGPPQPVIPASVRPRPAACPSSSRPCRRTRSAGRRGGKGRRTVMV